MNTKKKLIISISAICAVVVAAVITVVSVLAARTATVTTSNITVSYSANKVAATIKLSKATGVNSDGTPKSWSSYTELFSDTFSGDETGDNAAKSHSIDAVTLEDQQAVVFKFEFKCVSGKSQYKVILTEAITAGVNNKKVNFYEDTIGGTEVAANTEYTVSSSSTAKTFYLVITANNFDSDFTWSDGESYTTSIAWKLVATSSAAE